MKKTLISGIIVLLWLSLASSCQEQSCTNEAKRQAPINPNGDSELALVMRQLTEEADAIKSEIEAGQPIEFTVDHEAILRAHATEPEKANSPTYKAFAKLYLQSIEDLHSAKPAQIPELYDKMIDGCINCHKSLCPGPVVRIKKLYL